MLKILVTGGAGYIGTRLVPRLLGLGYKVTVLDNFLYKQEVLLDCIPNKNFELIRGDVRNFGLVSELVKGKDFIIPLACLVGAPLCERDPESATSTNLFSINFLSQSISKEQGIIYPNTNSGYGIGESDIFCTEESPLKPVSLYGQLKVQAEKVILNSGGVAFRLATVFGPSPRMRLDLLVNDFVFRAITFGYVVFYEGHTKRNYVYVGDVVEAFIFALNNYKQMKGQTYNFGLGGANLNKFQLCEEIKKQIPNLYYAEAEVGRDPDKRDYIVSNEKIIALGFKAGTSLQQGIAELIKSAEIIRMSQNRNIDFFTGIR